jgi:hypothetical protein
MFGQMSSQCEHYFQYVIHFVHFNTSTISWSLPRTYTSNRLYLILIDIYTTIKFIIKLCKTNPTKAPVIPRPIPGSVVLTPKSFLGSYIVPTDQHESFVRTLFSLIRTRENFPVGHPSQIAPNQTHLTSRFFRDRLPKKRCTLLVGYSIISIKPWARISQSTPLRRLTSSSVNPNPGNSPLSHVCVSSVVICHAMWLLLTHMRHASYTRTL